jgi:hypothetical protein
LAYGHKKSPLTRRRAVSQIIGSLVVLALVASIGSVILFQGLNQINLFNYDLTFHDRENNDALRENIIFEHVRFDPDSEEIELYLANVGSIDSTIVTATIVKLDSQELLVAWKDVSLENPDHKGEILIDDHIVIKLNATLANANPKQWNSTEYNGTAKYSISLTTDKGNFVKTVRSPGDDFNS